jgi:hypothetical protein
MGAKAGLPGPAVPPQPSVCVLAWSLDEGDVLPGGEMVMVVQREPVTGLVTVATDDGGRRLLGRDDRVMVVKRPVWRVRRFIAAILPGRAGAEVARPVGRW